MTGTEDVTEVEATAMTGADTAITGTEEATMTKMATTMKEDNFDEIASKLRSL